MTDNTKISGAKKKVFVYDPVNGQTTVVEGMQAVAGKQKKFDIPARLLDHDYVVIIEDAAKNYEQGLGFNVIKEKRNLEE